MLSRIALALVIIGAINWLLVGLFEWDLVTAIFGGDHVRPSSWFSRFIYILVGISGLFAIPMLFGRSERAR